MWYSLLFRKLQGDKEKHDQIRRIHYADCSRKSLSQETIDTCNVTGYNTHMIKSFAHKGLKDFYETGSKRGIQAEHASKLERMLDRLDASTSPQDMNLPGYRLHPLKGDKQDMWSVWVNGNWRMTFYFEDQDAYLVDYMDYH